MRNYSGSLVLSQENSDLIQDLEKNESLDTQQVIQQEQFQNKIEEQQPRIRLQKLTISSFCRMNRISYSGHSEQEKQQLQNINEKAEKSLKEARDKAKEQSKVSEIHKYLAEFNQ